ncbi:hypothetical protein MACK_001592 [Theileria orientalis]|uniref:t-SNARE coiled-coil homology domain-containing protein n=1 Tax=Theileria orientalis TaxID=68886 RepID=A0A976MDC1_THEOR|nr:hypothetical protein MACK_001592 [Theileria orientalis]
MFNRTLQLKDVYNGFPCDFSYKREFLITTSENRFIADANIGVMVETTFSSDFNKFMDEIETIKKMIDTIEEGAQSITKLMHLNTEVVTEKQRTDISTNMNALINRTNMVCTQCKESTTSLQKFLDKGSSSTENRMRDNAYNVVVKHFRNALKRYQTSQIDYKKSITDKSKRQLQLIYPDMNEEELDKLANNPNGQQTVEQIARSNFLGNVSLRDAVSNIQGKYNDILALEQSMEQLKQMMVELAAVVSYQGELIDQIEHNALKAVDYTGRANEQLQKAQDNKKKGSKLLTWFTVIVLLVGLSIMIPILLKIT